MEYTRFVNVFQGCGESALPKPDGIAATWLFIKAQTGNTVPHAVLPFGKMSCGAFTAGYPSGYVNYRHNCCGRVRKFENKMIGFSHLHHSGTGAIGHYYNYAVVTPTYGALAPHAEYFGEEYGEPGYYRCKLSESNILCETTVNNDVAYHRYTFDKPGKLMIDFSNNGLLQDLGLDDSDPSDAHCHSHASAAHIEVVGKNELCGRMVMSGIPLYVHIRCEGNVSNAYLWRQYEKAEYIDTNEETDDRFGGAFEVEGTCILKVAIAFTDARKAQTFLNAAVDDFDVMREKAKSCWESYLNRIEIHTDNDTLREMFYSNYYHTIVKPIQCHDDSFLYGDGTFFCDFTTMWDMYKTQLPFVFSLYPQESRGIAETMLKVREKLGFFPPAVCLSSNMRLCDEQSRMLMCYSLADAYYRGIVSADEILLPVWTTLCNNEKRFMETGTEERFVYILDIADICACMKKIALDAGNTEYAEKFGKYEDFWINAYDAETGLCSEKSEWYEGTNWNYSFRLLNKIKDRIDLCGKEKYLSLLDRFFGYTREPVVRPTKPNDAQGIAALGIQSFIGFNNETDTETPYAYMFAGRHDKTCEILRAGMRYMFTVGRGGLPANNDSGAMSSLYMYMAMGLFPVTGQNLMLVGSPVLDGATLHLATGKDFVIKVYHNSDENIYVEKAVLNGNELPNKMFTVTEFMQGGVLELYMSKEKMM